MQESYAVEKCEACGKTNRIYLGDMSDITVPDVQCWRCYHCRNVQWLPEVEEYFREQVKRGGEEFGYTVEGHPVGQDAVDVAVAAERKRCAGAVRKRLPTEMDRYDVGHSAVNWAECKMLDAISDIEEGK